MSEEINVTQDGKVKKVILREGTGDLPKNGETVEGKYYIHSMYNNTLISALCGYSYRWKAVRFI